jgi:hypothetical protein
MAGKSGRGIAIMHSVELIKILVLAMWPAPHGKLPNATRSANFQGWRSKLCQAHFKHQVFSAQ